MCYKCVGVYLSVFVFVFVFLVCMTGCLWVGGVWFEILMGGRMVMRGFLEARTGIASQCNIAKRHSNVPPQCCKYVTRNATQQCIVAYMLLTM